jgi:hypothetical protein
MNALVIIVPIFMSLLWIGLGRVADTDTLTSAAWVNSTIWACTALVIGVLR